MELAPKEQGPNLGEALVRRILTKVRGGFPSMPAYKGKAKRCPGEKSIQKIALATDTRTCCVGKFFAELNPTHVRNGTCSVGARPKPWRSLGQANFDESQGVFHQSLLLVAKVFYACILIY